MFVHVTVPASIERQGHSGDQLIVVEDSQVMLPCRVSGLPAPVVHWTKDNAVLSVDDVRYRVLRSHSLAIPVVRYSIHTRYDTIRYDTIR